MNRRDQPTREGLAVSKLKLPSSYGSMRAAHDRRAAAVINQYSTPRAHRQSTTAVGRAALCKSGAKCLAKVAALISWGSAQARQLKRSRARRRHRPHVR